MITKNDYIRTVITQNENVFRRKLERVTNERAKKLEDMLLSAIHQELALEKEKKKRISKARTKKTAIRMDFIDDEKPIRSIKVME